MALQTNLNKKDKITIAVLLFAAVIFMIAWFLIKPTITTIMTTDEKIEQAEAKQQLNKNKIMLLTSGEAIYNKAVDDLNESTAEYYDIMDSSEIDRMVTSYVLKSGLFAENLTINMPTDAVDESPYIYSTVSTGTNKNTTSDTTTESNNKADSLTVPYNSAKSKNKN